MERKLDVLVIDDSKVIIQRLVPSLKELSNVEKVMVGYSYEDGRKLIESHPFDVAVFDINLPEKSGIDLLRFLKEKQYHINKVIMMTDDPSEEKRELCMALKADFFINKFTDFENIPEIISDFKPERAL